MIESPYHFIQWGKWRLVGYLCLNVSDMNTFWRKFQPCINNDRIYFYLFDLRFDFWYKLNIYFLSICYFTTTSGRVYHIICVYPFFFYLSLWISSVKKWALCFTGLVTVTSYILLPVAPSACLTLQINLYQWNQFNGTSQLYCSES